MEIFNLNTYDLNLMLQSFFTVLFITTMLTVFYCMLFLITSYLYFMWLRPGSNWTYAILLHLWLYYNYFSFHFIMM
jgi:hypothetical protein